MPSSAVQADALLCVNELVVQLSEAASRHAQRRTDVRYPWGVVIEYGPPGRTGDAFRSAGQAWAIDVSYQGIGLLLQRQLEPGKRIGVQLPINDQPVFVDAEIVFCRHLFGTIHRAGGRFEF